MEGAIEDTKYPPAFINSFMRFYSYSDAALSSKLYKVICSYLKSFIKSNSELVFAVLKENLSRFATVCFSGVLLTLDFLNKNKETIVYKLPLLNYLCNSVNKREIFTLNEMVVNTFKFNESLQNENENEINVVDYNKLLTIIKLLNLTDLLDDGRECIWKLVFAQKDTIPFAAFNYIYKWKGDWEKVARFIVYKYEGKNKSNINESSNESNFVTSNGTINLAVETAIEASMNSLEAFSILMDFLIEFSPETFYNKTDFAQSILSQEINENTANTIIKFIKLHSANQQQTKANDNEAILLRPISNTFNIRAHFLNDIFSDVLDSKNEDNESVVDGNDIRRLFGLLLVIKEFEQGKEMINEQVEKLKNACESEKVKEIIKIPEMDELRKLLTSL